MQIIPQFFKNWFPKSFIQNTFPTKKELGMLNKSEVEKVIVDLIRHQRTVFGTEIKEYNFARTLRYDTEHPKTYALVEAMDKAMDDTHLTAVTDGRIKRIQVNRFKIRNAQGEIDESKSDLFKKNGSSNLLKMLWNPISTNTV